jgi:hypothetical protein
VNSPERDDRVLRLPARTLHALMHLPPAERREFESLSEPGEVTRWLSARGLEWSWRAPLRPREPVPLAEALALFDLPPDAPPAGRELTRHARRTRRSGRNTRRRH